ncbi:MAG: FAD:protein FMN transferase [Oscillospiraceae bacterium]
MKKSAILAFCGVGVLAAVGIYAIVQHNNANTRYTSSTFAMSTVIEQKLYGTNAQKAMEETEKSFISFENELSLFKENSDISRINAASGNGKPIPVKAQTFAILKQGKELSQASDNAFALTIAPLTLAWGITGDAPRVVPQSEIDTLLPLVNDNDIILCENNEVMLKNTGAAIDLGGIAKGTACNIAKDIYNKYDIKSAVLSIGGNIYVKGTKPDGSLSRIGFRNPKADANAYIASITMQDEVFAVSGGYERFFEENGKRYHHILSPVTGAPAESDIISVGVLNKDGTVADFYSTTLFVWGKDKTIEYMKNGGKVMMLCEDNTLYVSKSLENSFELNKDTGDTYKVIFI